MVTSTRRRRRAHKKPTRAEIEEERAISEKNDAYFAHLNSTDVLLRAQAEVIPELADQIRGAAAQLARFSGIKGEYRANQPNGRPLKLVVRPTRTILAPKELKQRSTGGAAAVFLAAALGGQGALPSFNAEGAYELIDLGNGSIVRAGSFRRKFSNKRDVPFGFANGTDYEARAILAKIVLDGSPG